MKNATQPSHPAAALFGRLAEKFFKLLERLVPAGYEDDEGFHYGIQPSRGRHMIRFHTETYARRPLGHRTRRATASLRSH